MRAALVLALLALLGAACNRSQAESPGTAAQADKAAAQAEKPPAAGAAFRPIAITVARAETRTAQRTVETSGSLLAWEEVQARAEQPGRIARLRVDLGDYVTAGQILADYDRREFEYAVEQARAAVGAASAQLRRQKDALAALEAEVARAQSVYEWSKSELERSQQLFDRQLIAMRDVDNARNGFNVAAAQLAAARVALAQHPDLVRAAEAEMKRAEAALAIAAKRLEDTTVRAPIAGHIARRHVSAGEFVKDSAPLFTIVVVNPLKYSGSVPERHAPEVRVGQAVRLTVEAHPGRDFAGTVTRVAPAVDVQTRTLGLEARVPNDGGLLRPGFFSKGTVLTQAGVTTVVVPAEAIFYVAGLTKVFVVTGSTVEERLVRPAGRQGAWVEVAPSTQPRETVRPGEIVATSNLPSLFDRAPVAVPGQ